MSYILTDFAIPLIIYKVIEIILEVYNGFNCKHNFKLFNLITTCNSGHAMPSNCMYKNI